MLRIVLLVASTALALWLVYRWLGPTWLIVALICFAIGSALAIRDIRRGK